MEMVQRVQLKDQGTDSKLYEEQQAGSSSSLFLNLSSDKMDGTGKASHYLNREDRPFNWLFTCSFVAIIVFSSSNAVCCSFVRSFKDPD